MRPCATAGALRRLVINARNEPVFVEDHGLLRLGDGSSLPLLGGLFLVRSRRQVRLGRCLGVASFVGLEPGARHAVLADPLEDVGGKPPALGSLGLLASSCSSSSPAARVLLLALLPASLSGAGSLPFRAFCLLACLRGGACGQLAVLFLLAAAKLLGLLAFLGFPLLSATCFPRLATHRPSLSKDRKSGRPGASRF